MNLSLFKKSPQGWTSSLLKTTAAVIGLAAVTGFFPTTESSLPITTPTATGDENLRVRAFETTGRLYVVGSLPRSRGLQPPSTAHVDVQVLARDGRILAEKREDIDSVAHPRTTRARSRRVSFAVSFPLDVARQATSIRVSDHSAAHVETGGSTGSLER